MADQEFNNGNNPANAQGNAPRRRPIRRTQTGNAAQIGTTGAKAGAVAGQRQPAANAAGRTAPAKKTQAAPKAAQGGKTPRGASTATPRRNAAPQTMAGAKSAPARTANARQTTAQGTAGTARPTAQRNAPLQNRRPAAGAKPANGGMGTKGPQTTTNNTNSTKLPATGNNARRITRKPAGKAPARVAVRKTSHASAHPLKGTLRMIPLGGMSEIGKNMTAYEYGNDIIIVDCGQSFPDESMPGVDAVIPDFTYVLQNRDRIRGIFLTHGHEDHIGGIPYLMKEIKAPVYGGRMTMELVKYKLEDRMPGLLKSCEVHSVSDGDVIPCGCFSVEFIHVNHSIADASMFAIKTPLGYIVHSGDFKIDYTPVDGGIMDLQRLAEIGSEGVLLFVCESTNIEIKGFSPSERRVGESFEEMFEHAKGRIFVATFSSNIYRLQQIISAAEAHGRKVALVGRSMLNVFNAANSLGYIHMKPNTLIDIGQIDNYPPEEVAIISTGSQGEPMSALTRIAFSNHREVEIMPGDTVIISATPIPGNEKPIFKVINELYRRGAKVYYSALAAVHVSGHAFQEEIKIVHALVKPKYFVPGHGEYRMLCQHADLAVALGMSRDNTFILENGDIFEVSRAKAGITGFTNGASVLIDGTTSIDDANNVVLRERKLLSDDGVVAIAMVLSKATGELVAPPDVHAMGFLYDSEYKAIISACERRAADFVRRTKAANKNVAETIRSGQMQGQLRSLLYEKTKRRPVVMISVIEV